MTKCPVMTSANGSPVGDNQNSLTAGLRGPLLAQDWHLFEKHAHFKRERIPERVVHAKGSGAYGKLTVTGDITKYAKAKVFEVGREMACFLRFPTVAGEKGAADAERDARGFAVKFYTEEGNWDVDHDDLPGYLTSPFCIAGFAIYWAGLSGGVSRLCFLLVQSGKGRVAGFGNGLAS